MKMFFQPNAWMDSKVMLESATHFNNHICQRWDKGTKVLLTCDNLSAHVNPDIKAAFAKDGVTLLRCFPAQCTQSIQPLDAAFGRSLRCSVGRKLDEWLIEAAAPSIVCSARIGLVKTSFCHSLTGKNGTVHCCCALDWLFTKQTPE